MANNGEFKGIDINVKTLKILKNMKNINENIIKQIEEFKNALEEYVKNSKTSLNVFNNSINNLINFIKDTEDPYNKNNIEKKTYLINVLRKEAKEYDMKIYNIYGNNYLKTIQELNQNLNDLINEKLFDGSFNPPNINEFIDSNSEIDVDINNSYPNSSSNKKEDNSKSLIHGYKSFYEKENNQSNIEKKENIIELNTICSVCSKNKIIGFCEKCNQLICKSCYDIIKTDHKHKIEYINELLTKAVKEKFLFIKSINYMIKSLLIKSNILFNSEYLKLENFNKNSQENNNDINNNHNNDSTNNSIIKIHMIKRILFNYPFIKDYKKSEDYEEVEFLKKINNILKNDLNQNNINIESFHISEMNKIILDLISKIFIDEKLNLIKETLEIIENNFYSDDENEDGCFKKESLNFKINEDEFNDKKNMFYYIIYLIPQRNIIFNNLNIKAVFYNKLRDHLHLEENNIFLSFNNKHYFINEYIKTKEFLYSSLKSIKQNYPDINKLYEYKIINDNILRNQSYKEYFDCIGNTLFPNSSNNLKRGSEKYYPPYGWFGIGLKVKGKYDKGNDDWLSKESNKWAIAYYPVGYNSSSNEIIEILNKIITKNELTNGDNQFKCSVKDKRHPSKKIGVGVYLTPDINIAERFSGKITINKKNYRVVLMAKILINEIREPHDINFWILNKEFIRFYRILVKESI